MWFAGNKLQIRSSIHCTHNTEHHPSLTIFILRVWMLNRATSTVRKGSVLVKVHIHILSARILDSDAN